MKNRNLLIIFKLYMAFLQIKSSLSAGQALSSVFRPDNIVDLHDFSAKEHVLTREKRQLSAVGPGGNGSPAIHRPTFYLNNASTPGLSSSLDLASSLVPVDTSFGVHQIALLNSPTSIQDVEAALQGAWWASNVAVSSLGPSSLSVKILTFRDYGMFSDKGLPVIDVTYVVGLDRSNVPISLDASKITLRIPDIATLAGQLSGKNLQLCDCDIYEGYLLHLVGIVSFTPNITSYHSVLQTTWISTAPELACPSCVVDIQFARTIITVGATGVRLTTVPYVVLLNGHIWQAESGKQPIPAAVENALASQHISVHIYRGNDTPTYAALTFVSYLNANIQFQEIAAVQRTVQSYLVRALPNPPLQVTIWNLEPFLNPQASVITQSSYFLTANRAGIILDPRLFYAPPLIDIMANQTDGNITTVTGGTLGIFPLYLNGHIQASQLRSIAEILKITYAESNNGLNPDEVDVAIVSLDDGISFSQTRRQPGDLTPVTELHVSAMVNSADPDTLPHLTPFHQLLSNSDSQDALNARLKAFNTAVCKDCQFRKLRSLNLLQVDPSTSSIPDAQAVLDKILLSWIAANPQSAAWLPLDVSLVSRDDSLANENGTLVSQLMYSVGYPLPAFTWYIPRDPDNRTLEQQLSLIRAVPFFGSPLHPQQIVLNHQMTAQDQPVFAASAMRAWAEDKDDLHKCQQANSNCFVAVVDPENPTVTMINGSPQYLYKYYILVDDKVYVPSETLSPAQQLRLRSALDSTNAVGSSSGVVVLPLAPVTVLRVTAAPVSTLSTTTATGSPPQGGFFGNNFNLSDSINLAVSTERQRNRVLEQITLIWQAALQPNVTNVHISTLRDVPGFPNPETVDGRPIRTVTYLLQGTGSGAPIDLNLAVQRFRQLLPGAGIPAVSAANPDMTTPSPTSTSTSRNAPPFVVFFDKTLVNGTTLSPSSSSINVQSSTNSTASRSPSGVTIAQIVPVQSSAATAGTTTPLSSSSTTQLAPTLLSTPPILVGPGPFILNDTIVVTADTRRSRDRVLEEQIRPIWQNVLGGNVTSFQLGVVRDSAFSTPQTPGGTNIRQIQYQVQGVAKTAVDSEAAKQQFRQAILANAPHNIWAVSNNNGSVILLPDSSNETSSTTVAAAVVVPVIVSLTNSTSSSTTASSALLELRPATTSASAGQYLGSLAMRNYNPSDQEAVVQTLQQLWTQALETNDNNVLVQYLPTSGNSSVLGTDGSPLFDLRYALFIQPNVTRPDVAWSRFLSLLRQSDLMDFISELPAQVPLNAASTTPSSLLSSPTVAVIPVLSFTEKQDIAIKDPSDVGSVADGLRILWANASGINTSSSEIRIISLTPLDPPKSSSTGLPVRTLTYGVTLQNVTDLPSVRARAEALVPTSSLKEYLVLPEQQTVNITSSTTKSSVILLVPARTAQTTTSQLSASTTLTPVLPGVLGETQTAHSLRIAVFNATDLDQLTNGIRNSWVTALDMQAQPQVVSITLTNVQPENVATQAGVPISTLFYDLQVPPNLQIGPDQEAAFLRLLLQSPARQYVLTNASSTLNPAMVGMLSENVMVPFSIGDTVILATNSHSNRDRILGQVKKTWDTTLAPNASNVQMKMVNDLPYTTPTTPDGVPIRSISYQITGQSNGLFDEYDAKSRFRQLAKTSPITGVWSVPDLPVVVTTPLSELPSEVVVLTAVATTTTVQPATAEFSTSTNNASLAVAPTVIPVEVEAIVTSTTPTPTVSYIQFLHLKRPVGPLDESTIRRLIAAAWADQNNRSVDEVSVRLLSTDAVVDGQGILGSNVTYELTGPPQTAPPSTETDERILAGNGWNVCQNCLAFPVHSFYITTDDEDKIVDPMALQEATRQAVILANPELTSNTIQTSFPKNNPIQQSNDVTDKGHDLLRLSYFAVALDQDNNSLQLREPSIDQLQRQFPGQIVYPITSPSIVRPVRLRIQNDAGSWTEGTAQPLDGGVSQQVKSAVDSAIESAATNHSLNCSNAQLLKSKNLYGQFGRQYTEMLFGLNNINGSCSHLSADIISEIFDNTRDTLNRSAANLSSIPILLPSPNEATDPNRVYHYDYQGKLNIFDLYAKKSELVTAWLQANPNCVQFNCSYSTQIMATQRRVSIQNGSDITRVYYTIHSLSPYAVYPVQQMQSSEVASRAVQKLTLFPGSQSNQQLQALISNPDGNSLPPPSASPVAGARRKRQNPDLSLLLTDVNSRYCFDPQRHSYMQYRQVDVVFNGLNYNDTVSLLNNGTSEMRTWNQTALCKGCICDIPVYLILLPYRANATSLDEQADLARILLQPWITKYANVTQELTSIPASSWSSYILGNPEYKYHNVSGHPLTLIRYGVQVAGAAPSQLLIPDLTRSDLEEFAPDLMCTACVPQLNQSLYLENVAPGSLTNVSAALQDALTQQWNWTNPTLSQLQVYDVTPVNDGALYTLISNESSNVGPLQRLDYVVGLTSDTNWTSLETLQEPTASSLTAAFSAILNNPNITVHPANAVQQINQLTLKTETATATPHWLPAAIIIPLAGVIALTLLVVCLITRASRLLRSKKTVVITDPSMIQSIGTESPFKEGNGKPNLAFDDYRNAGRQDISKV